MRGRYALRYRSVNYRESEDNNPSLPDDLYRARRPRTHQDSCPRAWRLRTSLQNRAVLADVRDVERLLERRRLLSANRDGDLKDYSGRMGGGLYGAVSG